MDASHPNPSVPVTDGGPVDPATEKLAELLRNHAPYDGCFALRVPGVHVIRRSLPEKEPHHAVAQPALCIVAQGSKQVTLGGDEFVYDEKRLIVFSVDLPIAARITRASRAKPFLGLRLDLDPERIAGLALKVFPNGSPRVQDSRAVFVGQTDPDIFAAAIRLVELMGQSGDRELIAPLVVDEILIRLLRGPLGARVAQFGLAGSCVSGVARAISWLRENYSRPVRIEELAELADMSLSTFHQHFKAVTSMSPLRYQKSLRLQEARRLMLSARADAGTASRRVGYLSASQFCREYGRFFGATPARDISRLRETSGGSIAG